MAYCTLSDLLKIAPESDLIELTGDAEPGVIDTDVVDEYIADAGALIDGYLRGKYALPLSPVPSLLKSLCRDITVYELYSRRMKLKAPEALKERRDGAIKILESIQKGTITLGVTDPASTTPSSGSVKISAEDRIFSRDTLENF